MRSYEEEWAEAHMKECEKRNEQLATMEAHPPFGFLINFSTYTSMALSFIGWIFLVMVPFSDITLLDTACMFVIAYVINLNGGLLSKSLSSHYDRGIGSDLARVLLHNGLIGKDIRDIKNILINKSESQSP